MKKILLMNGSPRLEKSVTLLLTRAFLEGLNEKGEYEVEQIDCYRQKIHYCTGCLTCMYMTEGKCVYDDDYGAFFEKYLAADLVIWSMPVYFYGMPAGVKAFFDRMTVGITPTLEVLSGQTLSKIQRRPLYKKTVLVATGVYYSLENNFEPVKKQFDLIYRGNADFLFSPSVEVLKNPFLQYKTAPYLKEITSIGRRFREQGFISQEDADYAARPLFDLETYMCFVNNDRHDLYKNKQEELTFFCNQMLHTYEPNPALKDRQIIARVSLKDVDFTFQLTILADKCLIRYEDFEEPDIHFTMLSKAFLDPKPIGNRNRSNFSNFTDLVVSLTRTKRKQVDLTKW